MLQNGSHRRLLKKLLLVELVGEDFYKILSSRERSQVLRNIYKTLERNEKQAALRIEQELKSIYSSTHIPMQGTIIAAVKIVSNILPLPTLKFILKSILNKRMYSNLSTQCKDSNPELSEVLVKHERLQHELLVPYWNQP